MNLNPPTGEHTEYGAFANIVVNTIAGYFRSEESSTCVLLKREVSQMEIKLLLALLAMLLTVLTRHPLAVSIGATMLSMLIDSGKLPFATCASTNNWGTISVGTSGLGLIALLLPIWAALFFFVFQQMRGASAVPLVRRTMPTTTLLGRLYWPIASQGLRFETKGVLVITAYKYTGDWYWLAALVYLLLTEGSVKRCRQVIVAILAVYGHTLTAMVFMVSTIKPTKKKLAKILFFLIMVNITVAPHTVIGPVDTERTKHPYNKIKWMAGTASILMALHNLCSPILRSLYKKLVIGAGRDVLGKNSSSVLPNQVRLIVSLILMNCVSVLTMQPHILSLIITATLWWMTIRCINNIFKNIGYKGCRTDMFARDPYVQNIRRGSYRHKTHLHWSIAMLLFYIQPVEAFAPITTFMELSIILFSLILYTYLIYFNRVEEKKRYEKRHGAKRDSAVAQLTVKVVGDTATLAPLTIDPTPQLAWKYTLNNWLWILQILNRNKLFCIITIILLHALKADASMWDGILWKRDLLWYEHFSVTGIVNIITTYSANYLLATYQGLEGVIQAIFYGFSVSFADAMILWLVTLFTIATLKKRIPGCNALAIIGIISLLQWGGLTSYYWWLVWSFQAANVLWFSMGSHPKLPGLLPMCFLLTVQPTITFFLKNHLLGIRVIPMWYCFVFFGTLMLELTPYIAQQTLVIEKDVVTGRIITQYRKNGPLTAILFGQVSATWDAVRQSAAIGTVYDRNWISNQYYNLRHLHMLVDAAKAGLLEGDVETVSDNRASGYITKDGEFLANCQAVKHAGMVGILANIHSVYDENGTLRTGLKYHFPGQKVETTADPVVSYAGNDLAILGPHVELKCAYEVSNSMPATTIVQGYDTTKRPFSRVVHQKCGMVQLDLTLGHSGCAMINPDSGKLTSILWLTSENAKTAQFISLNPWMLTKKSEVQNWVTQASLQLEKKRVQADLNDVRQRLAIARKRLFNENAKTKDAIKACDSQLEALEKSIEGASEEKAAELAMEHKLYLDLAAEVLNEKRSVLEKLRLKRTKKEELLKQRNSLLATDTHLVAELRKESKELNKRLEEVNKNIIDEMGFKIPEESRMPVSLPKINWPLIYKDGTKWYTYWSKTEKEESDDSPLSDQKTIERIMRETGLQRRAAIKFASGHYYNKEWAESMLQKANLEQSVYKAIINWWFGEHRVSCPYCDRKFECKDNHTHTSKCHNTNVTDCQRHTEFCSSNSYKGNYVTIEGWRYPIIQGKICIGHENHYLAKCQCSRNNCVTNQKPQKFYDFHRLNGKDDEAWYVKRSCVENLHRAYKAIDVNMPENESLLDICQRQNEMKSALQSRVIEIDRLNELAQEEQLNQESLMNQIEFLRQENAELDAEDKKRRKALQDKDKAIIDLDKEVKLCKKIATDLAEANGKLEVENQLKQSALQVLGQKVEELEEKIKLTVVVKEPFEKPSAEQQALAERLAKLEAKANKDKAKRKEKAKARREKAKAKESTDSESSFDGNKMDRAIALEALSAITDAKIVSESKESKTPKPRPRMADRFAAVETEEQKKTNAEAEDSEWEVVKPKEQRKMRVPKVEVTPPTEGKPEEAKAAFGPEKPCTAFVRIKADVHAKWNDGKPCKCHCCNCKDKCVCPLKMCIWCNSVEHDTKDCELAKKNVCGCGQLLTFKDKKHCCWKEGDTCVVCEGDHHPRKCHAVNHKYWNSSNREDPGTFARVFARPDFQ